MVEGSLARSYVEQRAIRRNKPAGWVKGSPPIEADMVDLYHMQDAHFSALGNVVVFRDGSIAVRETSARRTSWQTCD